MLPLEVCGGSCWVYERQSVASWRLNAKKEVLPFRFLCHAGFLGEFLKGAAMMCSLNFFKNKERKKEREPRVLEHELSGIYFSYLQCHPGPYTHAPMIFSFPLL